MKSTSREYNLNREQIELIKATCCKGATDEELRLFLWVAKKHRLDPLTRQLHAIKRNVSKHHQDEKGIWVSGEVMTIQVGIDGYRTMASRYKDYGGIDEPEYEFDEGQKKIPAVARVRVWKKGFDHPTVGIAYWDEYAPSNTDQAFMWKKMPKLMLAKCAEALALRKAYPELSDIYVDAELDQEAQNYTPQGRQITDKNGFAPDGRPVTYAAQHGGSREAAQAVAARKITEARQNKTIIEAQIVDETEIKTDPSWPSITIDWNASEKNPIVTGDAEAFKPLFDAYCKWGGDGFWRTEPRHVESIRSAASAMKFRVIEIMPKRVSAGTSSEDEQAGKGAGKGKAGTTAGPAQTNPAPKTSGAKATPATKTSAAAPSVSPTEGPQLVAGRIEQATPQAGKSPRLYVLLRMETSRVAVAMTAWDTAHFPPLIAGKGKQCELYVKRTTSKDGKATFTNIIKLKRVGATEYDEDGKTPIIQQRTREAGNGGNLFQP